MSGGKLIDHKKIVTWADNYKNNKTLSFDTNSASISLSELESFIQAAKANYQSDFDGIRIYFIRYPLTSGTQKIGTAGSNLSQPSIVLVPLKGFDPRSVTGQDYKVGTSEQVFALAFTDPESTDPGDTSILCPPRC